MAAVTYVAFVRRIGEDRYGVRFSDFPEVREFVDVSENMDGAKNGSAELVAARMEELLSRGERLPEARTWMHFKEADLEFPELAEDTAAMPVHFELRVAGS